MGWARGRLLSSHIYNTNDILLQRNKDGLTDAGHVRYVTGYCSSLVTVIHLFHLAKNYISQNPTNNKVSGCVGRWSLRLVS